jgi:hypothetical protein
MESSDTIKEVKGVARSTKSRMPTNNVQMPSAYYWIGIAYRRRKLLINTKIEMSVKLFTMVKDEIDIIDEWIIYHGSMFGWQNIHVIDNGSTDGTYQKIQQFSHLINIYTEPDYRQKGVYMKALIDAHAGPEDIVFPIDIDEFIVYYDGGICVDRQTIHTYLRSLPPSPIYKTDYIHPLIIVPGGYPSACRSIARGKYNNGMGNMAKSFFKKKYYNGSIDHGNHISCSNYFLTKLCLVHYHERNLDQMKKKTLNNVLGIGYPNSLDFLRNLIDTQPECMNSHHVKTQIKILEQKYAMSCFSPTYGSIDLTPLRDRIVGGYF